MDKNKNENLPEITTGKLATDLALLTEEEKKKYLQLAKGIDTHDVNSIQNYGNELSRIVSSNGDSLLQITQSNHTNTDDAVGYVTDLLSEVNDCNIEKIDQSPLSHFMMKLPLVRKFVKTYEKQVMKYKSVAENISNLSNKIVNTKMIALRDNNVMQRIFDNNVEYISQLDDLIIGGKLRLGEIDKDIETLQADTSVEPYVVQDMVEFKAQLEKRINDMMITRHVMTQDLLQIRALQNNNTSIAVKADNIVNNVIPIWKNQLAIAIIMNNQEASVKAAKAVSDATNKMLVKNAEKLKSNTISVAREQARTVIDIETLRRTGQLLNETVQEYRQIQKDSEVNRKEIENTIRELGEQLGKTLLESTQL
jgi:uncharacterized protein YaaN involved in tellurite resistance